VDRQFVRVVDVPLAGAVAILDGLWCAGSSGRGSVVSGLRGPPVGLLPGGPVVLAAGLHRRLAPTLAMELELGPWLLSGTRIELRPRCPVGASRRYFRAGHALLDEVVSCLVGRPVAGPDG